MGIKHYYSTILQVHTRSNIDNHRGKIQGKRRTHIETTVHKTGIKNTAHKTPECRLVMDTE